MNYTFIKFGRIVCAALPTLIFIASNKTWAQVAARITDGNGSWTQASAWTDSDSGQPINKPENGATAVFPSSGELTGGALTLAGEQAFLLRIQSGAWTYTGTSLKLTSALEISSSASLVNQAALNVGFLDVKDSSSFTNQGSIIGSDKATIHSTYKDTATSVFNFLGSAEFHADTTINSSDFASNGLYFVDTSGNYKNLTLASTANVNSGSFYLDAGNLILQGDATTAATLTGSHLGIRGAYVDTQYNKASFSGNVEFGTDTTINSSDFSAKTIEVYGATGYKNLTLASTANITTSGLIGIKDLTLQGDTTSAATLTGSHIIARGVYADTQHNKVLLSSYINIWSDTTINSSDFKSNGLWVFDISHNYKNLTLSSTAKVDLQTGDLEASSLTLQASSTDAATLTGNHMNVHSVYTDTQYNKVSLIGTAQFFTDTTINSSDFKSNGLHVKDASNNYKDLTLSSTAKLNFGGSLNVSNLVLQSVSSTQAASLIGANVYVRGVYSDTKDSKVDVAYVKLYNDITINSSNFKTGELEVWAYGNGSINDYKNLTLANTANVEVTSTLISARKIILQGDSSSAATLKGYGMSAWEAYSDTEYNIVQLENTVFFNGAGATTINSSIFNAGYLQTLNQTTFVREALILAKTANVTLTASNVDSGSAYVGDLTLQGNATQAATLIGVNAYIDGVYSDTQHNTVTLSGKVEFDGGYSSLISGNFSAKNIELKQGTTLDISEAASFTSSGAFINNGTLLIDTNSVNDFGGSGVVQFKNLGNTFSIAGNLSGSQTFNNIEVNLITKQADTISVGGDITGSHTLNMVFLGDPNKAPKDVSSVPTIVAAANNSGAGTFIGGGANGSAGDFGIYRYSLQTRDNGKTWNLFQSGFSGVADASLSTLGAISMGWFTQTDNLLKRMGELRLGGGKGEGEFDVWIRGYGQQSNAFLGGGLSSFREYQWGTDVGADTRLKIDENNIIFFGIYGGYQGSKRNFKDASNGKGETNSGYGGVYVSWLETDGWYADLALKGQGFSSTVDVVGTDADFSNLGFGASIEFGRQFTFEGGWFVEPSAQVSYLHIFSEDFVMSNNLQMDTADSDIYRFNALVRAGKTLEFEGYVFQPYLKGGVQEQISSGGNIYSGGESFRPNTDGTHAVFGAGLIFQLTQASQIHLDYEASFGDKYSTPWSVNAGIRFKF